MSDKPHFSPSQLGMLFRCPEQYRRRYIEGEVIPPAIATIRGTAVHGGISANNRQKIESHEDLPVVDVVEITASEYEAQLAGGYTIGEDEEANPSKAVGAGKDSAVRLAGLYAKDVAHNYQPVIVEQRVRLTLPGSHDLVGILDLADDQQRVIDFKTAAKSKAADEADKSPQLTVYAAQHKAITGELPAETTLETLVDTKTPKRQRLASVRDESDLAVLAAQINVASATIAAGVFPPNTQGWWCTKRWCGYFGTCPYSSKRGN